MTDERLYDRVAEILEQARSQLPYLPTEAELQIELTREREDAERVLRLTASPDESGAS